MSYIEGAPGGSDEAQQSLNGGADTDPASNPFDPAAKSASTAHANELRQQPELQAAAVPGTSAANELQEGSRRHRPTAKPRPRGNQQSLVADHGQMDQQLQQQEVAPAEAPDRFTRMLQESGVTAEDWEEEGAY